MKILKTTTDQRDGDYNTFPYQRTLSDDDNRFT